MASRKTLLVAAAMALIATAALVPATESQKTTIRVGDDPGLDVATESKKITFFVGDEFGWDVGVDYDAWKSGKKFKVGDILEFRYSKGQDVVLVDEEDFNDCKVSKNAKPLASGDAVDVILGQAPNGQFFFTTHAKGACKSGMKLAITAHN